MENQKKPKGKKAQTDLVHAYREYVLMEGKRPATVFKFCKELGITESEFYQQYASFDALEKAIWAGYVTQTRQKMEADEAYVAFSAREKILTFYFMLAEQLKSDRSFVLHQLGSIKTPAVTPVCLKAFKRAFEEWINVVLAEGKSTGEIAKRPYLENQYANVFWFHMMFILQFWAHDESAGFEKTDVAIEKSVTLAFDLIGKGVLDNALDFGKFLYQHSKN
ncbi:MAG: TetR/AcrR family transcriptional regulator [Flammeovirgaceae bacterium]